MSKYRPDNRLKNYKNSQEKNTYVHDFMIINVI